MLTFFSRNSREVHFDSWNPVLKGGKCACLPIYAYVNPWRRMEIVIYSHRANGLFSLVCVSVLVICKCVDPLYDPATLLKMYWHIKYQNVFNLTTTRSSRSLTTIRQHMVTSKCQTLKDTVAEIVAYSLKPILYCRSIQITMRSSRSRWIWPPFISV